MKTLAFLTALTFSGLSLANCNISVGLDTTHNVNNFNYTSPKTVAKILKSKGYNVRMEADVETRPGINETKIILDEFEGTADLFLKTEIINQVQISNVLYGAKVSIVDLNSNVLNSAASSSYYSGFIGLNYYPHHLKKTLKKLKTCSEL